MSTRNTVVCGVAGTAGAPVLERAYALARDRELTVRVVHAVDVPRGLFGTADSEALDEALAAARERALDGLAPGLQAAHPELDAREALERDLEVVDGAPWRALVEAGETAERLVVGAHEREGLMDLFGNTTRAVLAGASCPVWIQKGAVRPIRRVLAGVDLAPGSRAIVALAREEARAFGARLELVHVFELPELGTAFGYRVPLPVSVAQRARETAEREFLALVDGFEWPAPSEGGIEHHVAFVDGVPRHELLELAGEADLVVIGSHGHGGLGRGVLGGVASELVRRSPAPLLVQHLERGED